MERYAFVDVPNTEGTAHKFYGFAVDWHKLCKHVEEGWGCKAVFFYAGIEEGDDETAREFDSLSKLHCSIVRTKPVKIFKKPNRKVEVICSSCQNSNVAIVDMGYDKKGNCDVDLTIDALENAKPDTEYYLFTGDGDFEPLVVRVLELGVAKVHIVSSSKSFMHAGIPQKRLATKLKNLFKKYPGKVDLIEIGSLKMKIEKVLLAS